MVLNMIAPEAPLPSEELVAARSRHCNLSPRDHWENNGVLAPLSDWSSHSLSMESSLLWIGGASGNQDSWVTELSADIVEAITKQSLHVVLVYVFFDSIEGYKLTTQDFLRLLIARIIQQRPMLVLEVPELLNPRLLRQEGSVEMHWQVLETLLFNLNAAFLVIDRIDAASSDQSGRAASENIVPKLMELVSRLLGRLRVIVTSRERPPAAMEHHPRLSSIWRDTAKKPAKRDR